MVSTEYVVHKVNGETPEHKYLVEFVWFSGVVAEDSEQTRR